MTVSYFSGTDRRMLGWLFSLRCRSGWAGLGLFGLVACGEGIDLASIEPQPDKPPLFAGEEVRKIKIVGSSTVAPFSTTVAEQLGAATAFDTPIVETTGTGGGFKAFCQAVGPDEPSIVNASRQIKVSERILCAQAGVTDLVEVKIGFDGIVLANAKTAPSLDLTTEVIYRALAAELPDGRGGWQKNPNRTWRQILPELPDMPILVSGPPPTSGTRDAFVEIAMENGALALPELVELKARDPESFLARTHTLRNDGAWIDSGENDSAIIQTLLRNKDSLGILGFSFLEQNLDRVQGASIGGVVPRFEAIASGDYAISRSMYFYVKTQNLALVPGLEAFVIEFTQEDAWAPDGYLVDKGLIPLPEADRAVQRDIARSMRPMPPINGTP